MMVPSPLVLVSSNSEANNSNRNPNYRKLQYVRIVLQNIRSLLKGLCTIWFWVGILPASITYCHLLQRLYFISSHPYPATSTSTASYNKVIDTFYYISVIANNNQRKHHGSQYVSELALALDGIYYPQLDNFHNDGMKQRKPSVHDGSLVGGGYDVFYERIKPNTRSSSWNTFSSNSFKTAMKSIQNNILYGIGRHQSIADDVIEISDFIYGMSLLTSSPDAQKRIQKMRQQHTPQASPVTVVWTTSTTVSTNADVGSSLRNCFYTTIGTTESSGTSNVRKEDNISSSSSSMISVNSKNLNNEQGPGDGIIHTESIILRNKLPKAEEYTFCKKEVSLDYDDDNASGQYYLMENNQKRNDIVLTVIPLREYYSSSSSHGGNRKRQAHAEGEKKIVLTQDHRTLQLERTNQFTIAKETNISTTIPLTEIQSKRRSLSVEYSDTSSSSFTMKQRSNFWYHTFIKIPATSLLIALNVVLAVVYWNRYVSPDIVAKKYTSMMFGPEYEIWRCYTGSTAHFEIWHLGINMMSLYTLGMELEGRQLYTSISFFIYNVALIPIVSSIWILLQYLFYKIAIYQQQQQQEQRWSSTNESSAISDMRNNETLSRSTVGYSGILFAWMVVASLEQHSTCPIFFLPNLCFQTYTFGWFKFSFGPLVQLVVLQVILPRVSLSGHLAGIIAGFACHWGLLPLPYIQPGITVPILYLIYLRYIRQLPMSIPSFNATIPTFLAPTSPSDVTTEQRRGPSIHQVIFLCHVIVIGISIASFGVLNSLSICFALTSYFWWLSGYQICSENVVDENGLGTIHVRSGNVMPHVVASGVYARGYVVAAVFVLVTDSMTFGSWLVLPHTRFGMEIITLYARCICLTVSIICLVANNTIGPHDDEGIMKYTLGFTILHPARAMKDHPWLARLLKDGGTQHRDSDSSHIEISLHPSWAPFQGTGRVLGGGVPNTNSSSIRRGREGTRCIA